MASGMPTDTFSFPRVQPMSSLNFSGLTADDRAVPELNGLILGDDFKSAQPLVWVSCRSRPALRMFPITSLVSRKGRSHKDLIQE